MALADYVKYDPDILRRKLAGEYQLANQQQALQNAQMQQQLNQALAPYQQQEQLLQVQKLQQALDPAFQAQQNALNLQNDLTKLRAVEELKNQFQASQVQAFPAGQVVGTQADVMAGRGYTIPKPADPYADAQLENLKLNIAKAQRESDPAFQEAENQTKIRMAREIAKATAEGKPAPITKMNESDETIVKGLSTSNANKISIASQVESDLKSLTDKNVDRKTQLSVARGMIKTLNSKEGKDAVGAEEAARLASQLEFNFFSPYDYISGQGALVGRDMPGFINSATQTLNNIKGAIESNKGIIGGIESKYGISSQSTIPTVPNPKKVSAGTTVKQGGKSYRFDGTNYIEVK